MKQKTAIKLHCIAQAEKARAKHESNARKRARLIKAWRRLYFDYERFDDWEADIEPNIASYTTEQIESYLLEDTGYFKEIKRRYETNTFN